MVGRFCFHKPFCANILAFIKPLYNADHRIQRHCHNTQQHNGHKEPIHLEEVRRHSDTK